MTSRIASLESNCLKFTFFADLRVQQASQSSTPSADLALLLQCYMFLNVGITAYILVGRLLPDL